MYEFGFAAGQGAFDGAIEARPTFRHVVDDAGIFVFEDRATLAEQVLFGEFFVLAVEAFERLRKDDLAFLGLVDTAEGMVGLRGRDLTS